MADVVNENRQCGLKFFLKIVFEGNESDVDLIIIASGWTLLRFISKTTGDCIILPFTEDKNDPKNEKKGLSGDRSTPDKLYK